MNVGELDDEALLGRREMEPVGKKPKKSKTNSKDANDKNNKDEE